jgi:hypothetical protein
MLTACVQTSAPAPQPLPSAQPAPVVHSELGRRIQADIARLDAELRAPGVVAAEIGQAADLGGGLIVRPFAIVEDSRCPPGTRCLWPGRMRIRASVSGRESELELGRTLETPDGAIVLVAASPSPWPEWPSDELGPRPAYRFGFRRA